MQSSQVLQGLLAGVGERLKAFYFAGDAEFPNHGNQSHALQAKQIPLLHYRQAVLLPAQEPAQVFEKLFRANAWNEGIWRDTIYDFHHYHSTAHEVLGCYAGKARVQFGGDRRGETLEFVAGDVVLIPAGVAHKNLGCSGDFAVVGAYPGNGPTPDLNRGLTSERPRVDANIAAVKLPSCDPVLGKDFGTLLKWTA